MATLSFFGAARNVTGSRYVLEAAGRKILVDCGMFQEREYKDRNWESFPVPPASLDAAILTHGHLDHVGWLPRLAREGFRGSAHCTHATADIARIVMEDSGHIQEEDAAKKRRRHGKKNHTPRHPVVPLYTEEDAVRCGRLLRGMPYEQAVSLGEGVEAVFHDAGHILGSSMVTVTFRENGRARTLLFSGDVGRWDKPILRDPSLFEAADYLVVESTYGDRVHEDESGVEEGFAAAVKDAYAAGGKVVVPSFAIERAHEILYVLNSLLLDGRIPEVPVFLDSPMAIRVTRVFQEHPELYDREMKAFVRKGRSPFDFPALSMSTSAEESKAINGVKGCAVIIAGSGMCTGGRIKHHLIHAIEREENIVLFTGYQARGTLGREILEGRKRVRILGDVYEVRASVRKAPGFSGHADQNELIRWAGNLMLPPRRTFVTHGEPDAAETFAGILRDRFGHRVTVPEFGQTETLD